MLLIIARPFVFHGGGERATAGLVGALVQHGYDVHLLSAYGQARMPGVTRRVLPLPPLPSAARALALAAVARVVVAGGGWDVVQSHERTLRQDIYRAGEGCHRAYLESMSDSRRRRPLFHRVRVELERRVFPAAGGAAGGGRPAWGGPRDRGGGARPGAGGLGPPPGRARPARAATSRSATSTSKPSHRESRSSRAPRPAAPRRSWTVRAGRSWIHAMRAGSRRRSGASASGTLMSSPMPRAAPPSPSRSPRRSTDSPGSIIGLQPQGTIFLEKSGYAP